MKETTAQFMATFIIGVIIGGMIGIWFAPVTNGKFYSELRKRAITSSSFICSEAKETKFLYEQYEKKGN